MLDHGRVSSFIQLNLFSALYDLEKFQFLFQKNPLKNLKYILSLKQL